MLWLKTCSQSLTKLCRTSDKDSCWRNFELQPMARSARALPNLWRLFLVANPVVILNTTGAATGNNEDYVAEKNSYYDYNYK